MVCRGLLSKKGEGRVPPGRGWWEGEGTPYVSWIVGWCMAAGRRGSCLGEKGMGQGAGRGGQGGNMVCRGLLCGKEEGRVPLG